MEVFIQLLVSGIAWGFTYALIGMEFTLVWQSSHLLNTAHTMVISGVAYFFAGTLLGKLGLPIWLSVILALVFAFVMGYLISAFIFNHMRKLDIGFALIATSIFASLLGELYLLIWGKNALHVSNFLRGTAHIGSVSFASVYIYIAVFSIIFIIAYEIFANKTKAGMAMRCVAQNINAAPLMGIDVGRSINLTTAISCMICGIVSLFLIPLLPVQSTMADGIAFKGWIACMVGGFGYVPGTIIGGIFLGITENLILMFLPNIYKDVFSFGLLIIILLIRPGGIMRHKVS